jgi:hypothetical protein
MKPATIELNWRLLLLATITVSVVLAAVLADPIAQDPQYHLFADTRTLASIPNFMNVTSNFPFLIVGIFGLLFILKNSASITPHMKPAWLIFFFGIFMTAFGSGYYHLAPANEPLVWDRLPMTIGFMSLVAIVIAEYLSVSIAKKLLLPLLLIGFASVMYWSHTEALGRGDLRPYALVQFLPMLLIPLVISLYGSRSDLGRYIWLMIGFYVASKFAELFDAELYNAGNLVSGHALKHVVAALAPASLLVGLMQRKANS